MTVLKQAMQGRVRRYWPLVTTACIGFALSYAAWFAVSAREDRLAALEFGARADGHLLMLQGGIDTYLDRLVALRALYKSDDNINRTEFQTFADELLRGQTAIQAVTWIPRILHAQRADHELAAVRDGFPGYRITTVKANGDLIPSPEQSEYFPILFSSREQPGSRLYGLNLNDGGLRQRTIERARDADRIATSPNFTLHSGTGDRTGFFVTQPVYRADRPHETVEDRRSNLIGYVQAAFQTGVMIETILSTTVAPGGLDLYFFAADFKRGASPLYFHPSRSRTVPSEPRPLEALTAGLHWSGKLKVGDATWQFIAAPIPGGPGTVSHAGSWLVLAGCLLIVLLAVAYIWGSHRHSERLQVKNEQIDAALSNMLQGLLMFDSQKRIVICNRRYIEMYGLSPDVVKPGCAFHELICHRKETGCFSGDIEQYCADVDAAVAKGKTASTVVEGVNGRSINIVNQPMAGGGWVATHEDITTQRHAEQERDRSRALLDTVMENIPTAIIVKDARDFRYVLINRASEKYYGIPRDQTIGKTAYDVLPKTLAERVTALDRRLLQSPEQSIVDENQLETPGHGTRSVVSKRLCIFNNGKPQYLLTVVDDITEQKKISSQLQQAQKMEAVGNLTGGLAHDFNNLLTIIIGNLDLLMDDDAMSGAIKEKLATILQASERGATLTRQLLAFSRRQPLQAKIVDVNDLIKNTTTLLQRTLGENVIVKLELSPDLWSPLVDASQLEAAIVNIAINARDAMPGGGTLSIATRNADIDAEQSANNPGLVPGAYLAIDITDTGTGMPPEVLANIFEPFFTTKGTGAGTGLGLSMVYGFIKQSNGHIVAYSEAGIGTTFKLYLPRSTAVRAAEQGTNIEPHERSPIAISQVILAVDDNADVRNTAAAQLRGLGYCVLEADSAQAALDILDNTEKIDLLFTDIIMPGGDNGKELARKAQAKRPNLKVLFTSGFPATSLTNGTAIESGDTLLSKPYRKKDLVSALNQILHA